MDGPPVPVNGTGDGKEFTYYERRYQVQVMPAKALMPGMSMPEPWWR